MVILCLMLRVTGWSEVPIAVASLPFTRWQAQSIAVLRDWRTTKSIAIPYVCPHVQGALRFPICAATISTIIG
jgi:hypothetical protein